MSDVNVRIVINTSESVKNVAATSTEVQKLDAEGSKLQVNMNNYFSRIGQTVQVAMGVILANMVSSLQRRFSSLTSEILNVANQTAAYADKIDKMAERTQIARGELQQLEFVSEQTGVNFSVFDSISSSVNRRLDDMRNGTGRASEGIARLGVNVTDANNNLKEKGEIIREVITELTKMEDATERDALAIDILGRSADQLAPMLNKTTSEIEAMFQQSQRLNMEMSDRAIAVTVQYADELNILQRQMQALSRRTGATVAEGLIPFVQMASRALSVLDEMTTATPRLSRSFLELRDEVESLNTRSMPLIDRYQELTDKAELNAVEQEELRSILERLEQQLPATAFEFDEYGQIIALNTKRSEEFIAQQNEIMRIRTEEEYQKQTRALIELTRQFEAAQKRQKELQDGTAQMTVPNLSGPATLLPGLEQTTQNVRDLRAQILSVLENVQDLGREIEGSEQPIGSVLRNVDGRYQTIRVSIEDIAKSVGFWTAQSEKAATTTTGSMDETEQAAKSLTDQLDNLKESYTKLLTAAELSESDVDRGVAILRQIEELETELERRRRLIEGAPVKVPVEFQLPDDVFTEDDLSFADGIQIEIGFPAESIADLRATIAQVEQDWTMAVTDEERARLAARLDALDLELEAKIQGIEVEDILREDSHERQMQRMQEMFSFIERSTMSLGRIQSNMSQASIQRINREKQEHLKGFDERLRNENLTEQQRLNLIKQREEAENEYDTRLRNARRKQANNEKIMGAMQVKIQTARAIMEAAPNVGLMAAMGIVGALQLAAVLTAPTPAFKQGGRVSARVSNGEFLVDPATYSQNPRLFQRINSGFITGPGSGTSDSIRAELPNNSFVINAEATRRNRDFLQSLASGGEVGSSNVDVMGLVSELKMMLSEVQFRISGRDLFGVWKSESDIRADKMIGV
jgi:chromosome segregation ATPase